MTPTRLMYSKSNQAFVFTHGNNMVRLGQSSMFFRNKADAVRVALKQGLVVDRKGYITSIDGGVGELEGMNKRDKLNSLGDFTNAYIEAALWSTNDESDDSGGVPLDQNYDTMDLTHEALDKMIADCVRFQKENAAMLARAGNDAQNGHDFWLTRNGHGAGFWDRGYDEAVGKALTDAAHAYGEVNLYVSNGKIHHD